MQMLVETIFTRSTGFEQSFSKYLAAFFHDIGHKCQPFRHQAALLTHTVGPQWTPQIPQRPPARPPQRSAFPSSSSTVKKHLVQHMGFLPRLEISLALGMALRRGLKSIPPTMPFVLNLMFFGVPNCVNSSKPFCFGQIHREPQVDHHIFFVPLQLQPCQIDFLSVHVEQVFDSADFFLCFVCREPENLLLTVWTPSFQFNCPW